MPIDINDSKSLFFFLVLLPIEMYQILKYSQQS